MGNISDLSFEEAYEELQTIIEQLESGDLSLEDSVTLFERGKQLSDHCQTVLDKAELRVNQLTEDGELSDLA